MSQTTGRAIESYVHAILSEQAGREAGGEFRGHVSP